MNKFIEKILIIENKIVDLTWPGGLFEYEEFREIYNNSEIYSSDARKYIASDNTTEQQKIIIGYSMQGLENIKFLLFAKAMLELLNNDLISKNIFDEIIFPVYEWNTYIPENYSDNDVNLFLKSVLLSKKVSSITKEYIINEIFTGNAKLDILEIKYNK
jgi:hypothetical protein